jgi:hypothetical protein
MHYRKLILISEQVHADGDEPALQPVTRVAACAIVENPLVGVTTGDGGDLDPLIQRGATLGDFLANKARSMLDKEPQAYGKGALIGVSGVLEHGAALIHPLMGAPIRKAIGGGQALIPSNIKIGGPGTVIDVPLGHREDAWLFDFIDTMSVFIPDGPRPNEIVGIVVLSDGGRPRPRIGKGGQPRS